EHIKLKSRVDGVTKRVEDRLNVAGNALVVCPDVGHRKGEVLREGAGAIDADSLGVFAKMPPARKAVPASAADDVPFAADDLADVEIRDVSAHLDNLANELVTDH